MCVFGGNLLYCGVLAPKNCFSRLDESKKDDIKKTTKQPFLPSLLNLSRRQEVIITTSPFRNQVRPLLHHVVIES